MKENRVFFAALILSIIVHVYFFKGKLNFFESGNKEIRIPVTFIPGARKQAPAQAKHEHEQEQIVLPEDKPGKGGHYVFVSKDLLIKKYFEQITREIENKRFSPPESKHYGLIGNVTIGFTITPGGQFIDIAVLQSSGDDLLDRTAINAVTLASGRVKRPVHTGRNSLRVNVTVKYQYGL